MITRNTVVAGNNIAAGCGVHASQENRRVESGQALARPIDLFSDGSSRWRGAAANTLRHAAHVEPVLIDQKGRGNTNLIDVLDRVLDKGIVIDAWVRVALVGIDLMTIQARILVASIETYLEHAHVVAQVIQAPTMPPSRQIGSGRAKNQ